MKQLIQIIETLCEPFTLQGTGVSIAISPQKLPSVWLTLSNSWDIRDLSEKLHGAGCRLGTTTVYRPDTETMPHRHEVAYHFLLEGLPVTIKTVIDQGEALPSISDLFPNADWEERELMELCNVPVKGHPNPRRLFLDESVETGVFDRYVPFSDMTNLANADAVWARIRDESKENQIITDPKEEAAQ